MSHNSIGIDGELTVCKAPVAHAADSENGKIIFYHLLNYKHKSSSNS